MNKAKSTEKAYFKSEIDNLFSHALFYVLAVLFSLFTTINYFFVHQFFSENGSSDLLQLFTFIPYISILIIPCLCYKANSSIYYDFIPIKGWVKLLINYFTRLLGYGILLLLLVFPCIFINLFGEIEIGQFFTSFICLLFFGAALISICFFINEIIPNKIGAFLISTLILIIFNTSHLFSVYLSLPVFLSEAAKSLSFAWHFDGAGKGILDSRDYIWFFCVSILFLIFTFLSSEKKKGKFYNKKQKLNFTAYFLLIFLILLNSGRWYKRLDLSKNKNYSLSKYTSQLLANPEYFNQDANQILKITYYRSSKLSILYPQVRDITDFLMNFSNQNKNIKLQIINPDNNQQLTNQLESYGITSQQLRTVSNNSTQFINVYSSIVLEYGGNIQTIPFLLSAQTLEYDLLIRLKQIFTGKYRLVNIILGNGMNYDSDYDLLIPWLNSQGFICNPIFINSDTFEEELENTYGTLLVIGDSQINIEKASLIEKYILSQKGNAIFNLSPFSVNIAGDWRIFQNQKTNLVEMLENWGVVFSNNFAADISCSKITMYSQNENQSEFVEGSTYTKILNYPLWINLLPQENCKNGVTLFWPVELELSENAYPYFVTTPGSYIYEADKRSSEKLIETNPFLLNEQNISTFTKQTRIVGAFINGNLEGLYNYGFCENARIIVIPDQYFVNSLTIGYNGGTNGDYRNFDFLTTALLQLNNEKELAELHEKNTQDKSLYKITDNFTFIKLQLLTLICLLIILPLIISGVFLAVFLTKKAVNKKEIEDLLEKL